MSRIRSSAAGRGSVTLTEVITNNNPASPIICQRGSDRGGAGISSDGVIRTGVGEAEIFVAVDVI